MKWYSLIAAVSLNNVIGNENDMPWYLPEDLKRFKEVTQGHNIIMGRKTYESIGFPLSDRTNIVITNKEKFKAEGVITVNNIGSLEELVKDDPEPFIIGGASIYKLMLPRCNKIYMTKVHAEYRGDAFFPLADWDQDMWDLVESSEILDNGIMTTFMKFARKKRIFKK